MEATQLIEQPRIQPPDGQRIGEIAIILAQYAGGSPASADVPQHIIDPRERTDNRAHLPA